jgi:hypothetical protein
MTLELMGWIFNISILGLLWLMVLDQQARLNKGCRVSV